MKEQDDPRIKIFSFQKNTGSRIARNNNIKHAKGDYVAVINSDDVWMLDKLENKSVF